jgi:hypothetical protein
LSQRQRLTFARPGGARATAHPTDVGRSSHDEHSFGAARPQEIRERISRNGLTTGIPPGSRCAELNLVSGGLDMIRVFASRAGRLLLGIWVIILATSVSGANLVPVASHHQSPAGTSTLTLVLLNSTDGTPHWGQSVTFNVSTTATTQPNVSMNCYQNGTLVFGAEAGFYPGYPWPDSQVFVLSSPSWTGGSANCTAALYYFSGKKTITLTTMSILVYA